LSLFLCHVEEAIGIVNRQFASQAVE
jgi:hypothetical protein